MVIQKCPRAAGVQPSSFCSGPCMHARNTYATAFERSLDTFASTSCMTLLRACKGSVPVRRVQAHA